MRLRWLAPACIAGLACTSTESRVIGEAGEVRGAPAEAVAVVYVHAWQLAPRVAERLGVQRLRCTAVVRENPLGGDACVATRTNLLGIEERRIEIGPRTFGALEYTLAHELVHWHANVEPWSRVPHAVQEGLADLVAFELVPHYAGVREPLLAEELRKGAFDPSLLELDSEARHRLPKEREALLYAVGYAVAKHHGVEGLRALCERARAEGLDRIPVEWLEADAAVLELAQTGIAPGLR